MFNAIYIIILFGTAVIAAPKLEHFNPIDGRIVGGQSTDISKHPWQVSVQYDNQHICGGSILTKQWILTAAVCLPNDESLVKMRVRVGSTNRTSGGEVIKIVKVIFHPDWGSDYMNLTNNIALAKLESSVSTSEAKAVSLPTSNTEVPDGEPIAISGWGLIQQTPYVITTTLREATVPKVSDKKCKEIYSKTSREITDDMLCAGVIGAGGKGPCEGDEGGPATYNNTLVGIISWGLGCADATYPSVYVRVSKFLDWINSNID